MLTHQRGVTYEVRLRVDFSDKGNSEILKKLLGGMGIDENSIIECKEGPDTYLSVYFNSDTHARSLQKKLRKFHLKEVDVAVRPLHKKDWQTKWKKDFKPFSLAGNFAVIPKRFKNKHRIRGRAPIYLDTDLAFGTGLHATTRFMAQFVDRYRGKFTNFLDLGTGTGILAIIAAKCGIDDITAIDICSEAVEVAKRNRLENDCPSVAIKCADAQKYKTKRKYDFVCANILTQDLIRMAAKIISLVKPGKYLAVSGISLNNYDIFRQAYAQYPLRCLKIEKGEGWVALLYKRIK